jgi:hypothetical protein
MSKGIILLLLISTIRGYLLILRVWIQDWIALWLTIWDWFQVIVDLLARWAENWIQHQLDGKINIRIERQYEFHERILSFFLWCALWCRMRYFWSVDEWRNLDNWLRICDLIVRPIRLEEVFNCILIIFLCLIVGLDDYINENALFDPLLLLLIFQK